MKRIEIKLIKKEKVILETLIKKGTAKAREITRARTLLLSDSGEKVSTISRVLSINPATVRNIKSYYLAGGLDSALYDAPRPGAPSKFTAKDEAAIQALACTDAPEGHAKWSLRLLAKNAVQIDNIDSISAAQVDRILKKTK